MTESGLIQSWRSLPFLLFATLFTSLAIHRRQQKNYVLDQMPLATGAEDREVARLA
jgi:hypothetical protein